MTGNDAGAKGSGAKIHLFTVCALSAPVKLGVPPAQVGREVLLASMKDKTLATAEMKVVRTRTVGLANQGRSAN